MVVSRKDWGKKDGKPPRGPIRIFDPGGRIVLIP